MTDRMKGIPRRPWMDESGMTSRLYGILGHPLAHSLSPAMQNAAFAAAGIDALYVPIAVSPDRIRAALRGLKFSGFSGFNVTVPYKQTVLPFLDRVSPSARAAGAVNTIVADPKTGRWTGHNTDVYGFLELLVRARISFAGKRILLLGAGGAARAVLSAIASRSGSIMIRNRTPLRAVRLRALQPSPIRQKIHIIRNDANLAASGPFDLIINSTSVGLKSRDRLDLPSHVFDGAGAAVDLIYNPAVTPFIRAARRAGYHAVNGVDMLLHQGARAFELWTRRPAPVAAMRRALMENLKRA